MGISRLLISFIRRLKSVLLLCITISLLFYYTFQNEIDILNSYAENEFLPSINNEHIEHVGSTSSEKLISNLIDVNPSIETKNAPKAPLKVSSNKPLLQGTPSQQETPKKSKNDLSDPVILRDKNKYFPLLLSSPINDPTKGFEQVQLTTQQLTTYKEKYPVLYEVSLSSFYSTTQQQGQINREKQYHGVIHDIQSNKYTDSDTKYSTSREQIRSLFMKSWEQQRIYLLSQNMNQIWPLDIIDQLDTLYIMNEFAMFDNAVAMVANIDFKLPPDEMIDIDIADVSNRALGGLLSAYELSQNKVLLTQAKDLADFILRSFDTPNRIPLLHYSWKSNYNNRFPYKEAHIADFTKTALEFTRLSKLTNQNKYFDAIYRIYQVIANSNENLYLESLFPNDIDGSTCSLLTNEEIQKGDHQRDSRIMRSIDENLKFVQCLQTGQFHAKSTSYNINSNILPLYDSLAKLSALTHTDIVLNSEYPLNNSTSIFHIAMSQITSYFSFQPATPYPDLKITLLSNIDTHSIYSPSTNELTVQMRRDFKFHPESCSMGALLSYGNKIFKDDDTYEENIKYAEQITESCFHLTSLLGGVFADVSLDPCTTSSCGFDSSSKIDNILKGKYVGFSNGFVKDTMVDLINITPTEKDIHKRDNIPNEIPVAQSPPKANGEENENDKDMDKDGDEVEDELVKRSFNYIKDEIFMNIKLSPKDVNVKEKTWKSDPKRELWINNKENMRLLTPDLVKSLFVLFRMTGDDKWRDMGTILLDLMVNQLSQVNTGAKGTWRVAELNDNNNALPSYWFSQTLKYYYLLFSNPDNYSLDEFIFTDGAHLLRRHSGINVRS